ncbi:DUF962 domain-containing protein [Mucilaginibacter arboris]|uniref:DUF962 domain-containing protein n=1 Tax=Mucilaginibacter arboris TaxID=2682090 RepID=A0A7K1SUX2_9SPHI|nr:hypothetical protein [Mucilaginibacter arboris]MVN21038.1 hypothetical protein [Mucilaginibacter arboris]
MVKKETSQRKIDSYFNYYSEKFPNLNSKIINGICAIGMYFGLLGLSWSIPFPHFNFLGQYNSYFNWASFVIAFSIYYYSKLSPLLSYLMLFLALVFTYVISLLASYQLKNGLIAVQFYFLILFVCGLVHYLAYKTSGKSSTLKMELLFILIGPIWVFHFMLKKFNIRY